jgi:hypothetical protein
MSNLKKVLFPAPLGPITQRVSPFSIRKLIPSTTWAPPKLLLKSFVSNITVMLAYLFNAG